jgi:hypothetical protein
MQPIHMPICEVCDRYTIALLKHERLADTEIDKTQLLRQITYYRAGINLECAKLQQLVENLKHINGEIWDAESAIRQGQDARLGLEEIGRRALKIRNLNRIRVQVKNQITRLVGQPEFTDCKMNHASADFAPDA